MADTTNDKQIIEDGTVVQGDGTTPVGDQVKQDNDTLKKGNDDVAHDAVADPQVATDTEENNLSKDQVRAEKAADKATDGSENGEAAGSPALDASEHGTGNGPTPTADGGAQPGPENEPENQPENSGNDGPTPDDKPANDPSLDRLEELRKDLEQNRFQQEGQPNEEFIYLEVAQSKIDEILMNISQGNYLDGSTKFDVPKHQLAADLRVINRADVAEQVEAGEFDQ